MGRADIGGEAAPTVGNKEAQPQHVRTLAHVKWGSGAAKAPTQRLACLSPLSPAKPGTGLVLSSLRQDKAKISKSGPQAPSSE